ncbi:MAG: molecular chaperone DnaJ [Sphingobacteriales bacterium 17-39-43]|uniref:J domain-containing protein n=1 Tax=Daejeonella sp. TaxID=2805397 RepID=UPI000BD1D9A0|nr:J domain-containing protein [Daejeonella sp.]OYZ29414.1 MAG: molecular chaperone DnaJ [Sphingobacteriales bacterium 16-39-50]OZA22505.1 MAG: molecular chaperone DnaJ [Sphingobacteriales bacterium 17-39-43]HQT24587.1 J domain-containing protein [Daejeonella sp.]HQT59190.1 J domain-containing protein [Daejeonella sp.]
MAFIDYYQALGITKSATDKDIKAAYRKMARKYHPDVNPNDKDAQKKFQEINEANEVLSDPEKRKKYDQYGKDWKHADQFQSQGQGRPSGGRSTGQQDYTGSFSDQNFSDFFSSMFGKSSGQSRQANFKGQDFNAELRLNLRDVYTTQKQTITVNGKNIRLTIPAGIENGQTIKIKGHGGPGINGGPSGDLFITFSIPNDPEFKRVGNDLYKNVEIDLYTAVLGTEITVDTMSGKVKLPVKPETQNGTKVKLKGKGFPVYKNENQFGDLYITYTVKIPSNLSEKEKELFKELSNLRK